MTTNTTALVKQLRDALNDARDDVQAELQRCTELAGRPATDRRLAAQVALALDVDNAIADADEWLASPQAVAAERDAVAQDRIDAARYRVWRETYTVPDGEPCTELDISIADAWTADALDAVLDAEIRQRITDPLAPGGVPPGAGAGCQAPCRCGPEGCADSACPGRTA